MQIDITKVEGKFKIEIAYDTECQYYAILGFCLSNPKEYDASERFVANNSSALYALLNLASDLGQAAPSNHSCVVLKDGGGIINPIPFVELPSFVNKKEQIPLSQFRWATAQPK